MSYILQVNNLNIAFKSENDFTPVVNAVSFELKSNEILGIVGESGSGKSVTALSVLGLLPHKNVRVTGSILFEKEDLVQTSEKKYQQIRGKKIAMIFQEPMSSLNPSLTCGFQVMEMILQHQKCTKKQAYNLVLELFDKVKLPRAKVLFNQYPHQLSGGQKQRVMIAMAIACKPQILIADEPTTALDVTVQKEIITLLKELQLETGMSILFITHDLALVSEIAHSVLVMHKGEIVENGEVQNIFKHPKENYTKALLNAKPKMNERLKKLPTVADFLGDNFEKQIYSAQERQDFHNKIYKNKPLLEVIDLATYFSAPGIGFFGKKNTIKAVDEVSFNLYEGETMGLVGESGCGKTTLGRTILQLEKATKGSIFYKGDDITQLTKSKLKQLRSEVQIIFQDPFSSLNPRIPVGKAIMEPMVVHGFFKSHKERKEKALELLKNVGLGEEHFNRYPHEFSGGQRQRIGIARAIAVNPKLIICDESVSALDVSVQAQVLNLLNELKNKYGFTYIFISHDLAVVKFMSDQLIVMNGGKIEEIGDADAVYKSPKSPYSKKLIDAIPKGI